MSTAQPYVPVHPGDLITAETFNDMQNSIRADIAAQAKAAADAVKQVDRAGDAAKVGGQTPEELTKAIVEQVLTRLAGHSGYRRVFKRLRVGEQGIIKHELGVFPLVDVYRLEYFPVVARYDDEKQERWVNMFLFHTSDQRISKPSPVLIQESRGPNFRIPLETVLHEYGVQYTDDASVGDLITELWKAIFSDPNDRFDENQFAHSAWFERCCSDDRSVGDLKRAGSWNDLFLKVKPRKTINYPAIDWAWLQQAQAETRDNPKAVERIPKPRADFRGSPAPADIEVAHFDLQTVGIRMIGADPQNGIYRPDPRAGVEIPVNTEQDNSLLRQAGGDFTGYPGGAPIAPDEVKLMVLLQGGGAVSQQSAAPSAY